MEALKEKPFEAAWIRHAQKWGVEVPPEILELENKEKAEYKAKKIAELQSEIKKLEEN